MIAYTDLYNQARLAGAKPLIHCYIKSDYAWRCFGKEYPNISHLRSDVDVYEWQARVLSFGDYRISLASESDNVFLALTSQQMNSYTISLDNADRFFTLLLETEALLFGKLQLYQGFAYPGFTFSDFLPLFSGQITNIELTTTICQLTADIVVNSETASEPGIDTTTTYSLSVDLDTETAAEETLDYTVLADWYDLDSWEIVLEIDRTADDTEEVLLSITNAADSATRIEIGIDSDDKIYLAYSTDIDNSATKQTLTGFDVAVGYSRIQIGVDPSLVNFSDNHGNSASVAITITTGMSIEHYETIGNTLGRGIATDSAGNIYIADTRAEYSFSGDTYRSVLILDENYTEIDELPAFKSSDLPIRTAPHGIFYDPSETGIYLSSQSYFVSRIDDDPKSITFYQDGLTEISQGYGIIVATYIYIADGPGNRIVKLNRADGSYIETIGNFGTGNLEFDFPIDLAFASDDNILILDSDNKRVQKMTQGGVYISQFGSDGTGDGQFRWPVGIAVDEVTGDIYVADATRNDIQRFNSLGVYQEKISLNFSSELGGLAYCSYNTNLYVVRYENDIVEISTRQAAAIDFSDNGSDDTVKILPNDNNTQLISATVKPVLSWQNIGEATATDLVDQIGTADLAIVDGEWTEYGSIDAYTEEADEEEALTVDTELTPDTTDYYTSSSEQNVFLPLIFGNMNENSDTGAVTIPCIDTINFAYCVSGRSCMAGNISVYADGVLQSGNYTYYENQNYLSLGKNIAVIVFSSDPGDAVITVKCMGHPNALGTLMTNPIDIIEDLIAYAAELNGSTPWELDDVSFIRARQEISNRGYTCAGVIQQANTIGYWIKAILACFLMTPEFNSEGKLAIRFMSFENTEDIKETIEEYQAISLSASQKSENLCNRIIINYANSYTEIDKRYKTGGDLSYFRTLDETNETSKSKYGEHQYEFNFDWTRNDNTVLTVATILLNRYNNPLWTLNYTGQDFKYLPLELLDQVEGTFNFFPGQTATCELREKIINLDNFTSSLLLQVVNFEEIPEPELNYNIYIGNDRVYIGSDAVYFGV